MRQPTASSSGKREGSYSMVVFLFVKAICKVHSGHDGVECEHDL